MAEGHSDPPVARQPDSSWTRRWPLASLATALSLLLGLVYLALRLDYTFFYSPLGTTPEEVGLTETAILIQSASAVIVVWLLFLIPFSILFLGGAGLAYRRVRRQLARPAADDSNVSRLDVLTEYFRSRASGGVFPPSSMGELPTDVVLRLQRVGAEYDQRRKTSLSVRLRFWMMSRLLLNGWRFAIGAMAALAAYFLPAAILMIGVQMPDDAAAVKQGTSVEDPLGLPVSALAAHLESSAGQQFAATAGHCVMYLGQSNGSMVLYDVTEQATIRVPASDVVLIVPRHASCGSS